MITIKVYSEEIYLIPFPVNSSFNKKEAPKIKYNRKQILKFYLIDLILFSASIF